MIMDTELTLFPSEEVFKNTSSAKSEISGYQIYAPEQSRRTIHNDLPEFYPDLPSKKYEIIYADPPWDYGGKLQFDKSSIKTENKDWKKGIFISAANFKYPTVKTKDLMRIPLYKKFRYIKYVRTIACYSCG